MDSRRDIVLFILSATSLHPLRLYFWLFTHILQFEEALTTDKKKLSLPDDKPLTDEDCDFLQNIFCPVLPDRKHTVDLSHLKSADKIQGYAIVLKLIDGKKLNVLVLSATKFTIVIGSLCAYVT